MDNYRLEEVKNLLKKNLMTPEVMKNILKSSTRRIEAYNDDEAVEILKYLSLNESIPDNTKEEINKYLAQYEKHVIEDIDKENEKKSSKTTFIAFMIIAIIILLILLIFIKKR